MDTAPPSVLNNTGTPGYKSWAQVQGLRAFFSPVPNFPWAIWDLYFAIIFLLLHPQPQVREDKGQMCFIQFDLSTNCHASSELIKGTQIIFKKHKNITLKQIPIFSWGRRMWLGRISKTERWFLDNYFIKNVICPHLLLTRMLIICKYIFLKKDTWTIWKTKNGTTAEGKELF